MVTLDEKDSPDSVRMPTPTGGRESETLATSWVGVTDIDIPLPPKSCKKSSSDINENAPSKVTLPMLTLTWACFPTGRKTKRD